MCKDFQFGTGKTAALAAFAHEPLDARSACVAAIQAPVGDVKPQVVSCRPLGAPVVIVLTPRATEVWRQGGSDAELVERVVPEKTEPYFRAHASELAPGAVFRAKTWGRLDRQFQLKFVDAGLMPLVEEEIGQRLTDLIGRVYQGLLQSIWPKKSDVSLEDGHWLIKAAFWLLAAKILRDKRARNFITLDLLQVEDVFARVARHYDSTHAGLPGIKIGTRRRREALDAAAQEIARFSHLGHVTTESLSHVYESALITPGIRKSLGTHSTPQYLVDYVVWKLRPWIEDIPEGSRHIFEPACGHAAFLVASIRLLKDLLSKDKQIDRKQYLRSHLHGVDIDSFAIEIARLSLTLADIPNPNGWDLTCDDMFTKTLLGNKAQQASILLGNPPFENFTQRERDAYGSQDSAVAHLNKTAEVLGQVLPRLPIGGVFGFVVPKGFLHSRNAHDIRSLICRDFEIREICLLPDKVFSFSDAESAVILGRRVASPATSHKISYRRVREADMERFQFDYIVSSRFDLPQAVLCADPETSFRLPELYELWASLASNPRLSSLAGMGQGLFYKGRGDLKTGQLTTSPTPFLGAVKGFASFTRDLLLHELPRSVWMSLDKAVIDREVTGATTGIAQVLLNYAPVSRGPWRLKTLIDKKGHPVTSRFITVRPVTGQVPIEYLWALMNSPLANAYAFSHLAKRDVLVGTMRKMPVPMASEQDMRRVAMLVHKYIEVVKSPKYPFSKVPDDNVARTCLLTVDAEVLRLYDLQPKPERQLLDLFAGQQRAGVPFKCARYFPEDFELWLHLHEYLSEEFRNSRASALLESHRTFDQPEVSEALRHATEDFEE